jgi:hypothetical protein
MELEKLFDDYDPNKEILCILSRIEEKLDKVLGADKQKAIIKKNKKVQNGLITFSYDKDAMNSLFGKLYEFDKTFCCSLSDIFKAFLKENNEMYFNIKQYVKILKELHPELRVIHTRSGNQWSGIGVKP